MPLGEKIKRKNYAPLLHGQDPSSTPRTSPLPRALYFPQVRRCLPSPKRWRGRRQRGGQTSKGEGAQEEEGGGGDKEGTTRIATTVVGYHGVAAVVGYHGVAAAAAARVGIWKMGNAWITMLGLRFSHLRPIFWKEKLPQGAFCEMTFVGIAPKPSSHCERAPRHAVFPRHRGNGRIHRIDERWTVRASFWTENLYFATLWLIWTWHTSLCTNGVFTS